MGNPRDLWPVGCLFTWVLAAGIAFPAPSPARAVPLQSATNKSMPSGFRSCSANPLLGSSAKVKGFKKSKHPVPPETPPTCMEVKGKPIEIQEFLQSIVRELQWRIGENHASEETWTFIRYLNDDELAKYSDTRVLVEPVVFTSGKAAVTVHTTELSDGFVRLQVATHIRAEGKSTDKVSAQPGTSWPLGSKGVLEQELVNALETRYKHTE
jgi:hypothetical protein